MSLQWTLVATFLYAEIIIIFFILLSIVKPQYWRSFINSRFVSSLAAQSHLYLMVFIGILALFFVESVREVYKYNAKLANLDKMYPGSTAYYEDQMRLFRGQRNFYIAGFALFALYIIKRVSALLTTQAKLMAEAEASLKQAKSASDAARLSSESASSAGGDSDLLLEMKSAIGELKKEKQSLEKNLEAMKNQAEATGKEYDRLTEEYAKLQRKYDKLASSAESAKDR